MNFIGASSRLRTLFRLNGAGFLLALDQQSNEFYVRRTPHCCKNNTNRDAVLLVIIAIVVAACSPLATHFSSW